jgi:2-methylcitrate dehydratase
MSLADELSRYALGLRYADLGEPVVHTVKQRLVESVGCGLGAIAAVPVRNARAFAREHPSTASTVMGTTQTTTPDVAAFVNGTMVRYLDFNDAYVGLETGHPSDNIPACLAVAEAEGATGEDLVLAIVLAYEIQCGLQDAANLHARGWDHVNYVLLSSAIAAGKLMGLSRQQMTEAINIALNSHIAMRQTRTGTLSQWKGAAAANAARNGIVSASLARHGFTGPSPVFEGEMGFMNQVAGDFSLDVSGFGNRENQPYAITRTLTKLFPASGQQQTAIVAALAVRDKIPSPDAIETVLVETTRVAYERAGSGREKWQPATRETADHSLPYSVASALLNGAITTETYSEDAISNTRVRALMQRVAVREDPALTAMFPEYMPTRVTVRLSTGQVLTEEVLDMPGGPRAPMTDRQVEEKFHGLLRPLASGAQRDSILSLAWSVEQLPDLAPLLASMTLITGTE